MGALKPQRASTSHLEALDLLRQAWRHIESSKRLLRQARRNATDNVVVEGLLILAWNMRKNRKRQSRRQSGCYQPLKSLLDLLERPDVHLDLISVVEQRLTLRSR